MSEVQTLEAQLTPAQSVQKSLEEKGITQTLIQEIQAYKDLKVEAHIDEHDTIIYNKKQLDEVEAARKKIKNTRVLIEKTCKSFRDEHTAINRIYSAKESEYVDILSPIEKLLMVEENKVEELKKQLADKKEKELQDNFEARVKLLIHIGATYDGSNYLIGDARINAVELKHVSDDVFHAQYELLKANYEKQQAVIAEEKRLAKVEADRLEQQRIDQQKAQEAIDKKVAELKAAQDKIDAENKRIADEKIAAENKIKRDAELETARKEAAAKAIKDAEEKAKRDADAKAHAEKLAAEKEAKRIARMPDKKLLQEFAENILFNTAIPTVKSAEAKAITEKAKEMFVAIETFVKNEITKL